MSYEWQCLYCNARITGIPTLEEVTAMAKGHHSHNLSAGDPSPRSPDRRLYAAGASCCPPPGITITRAP